MKNPIILLSIVFSLLSFSVFSSQDLISTSPDNAVVYFIEPHDGQTIRSDEVVIKFGLSGMGIAPAGIEMKNTGHHHLLIDVDQIPDLSQPLPSNDHVKHFGKGQTETKISLEPGQYTLQLLLGNHLHIPHDPPVISEKITILVE